MCRVAQLLHVKKEDCLDLGLERSISSQLGALVALLERGLGINSHHLHGSSQLFCYSSSRGSDTLTQTFKQSKNQGIQKQINSKKPNIKVSCISEENPHSHIVSGDRLSVCSAQDPAARQEELVELQ